MRHFCLCVCLVSLESFGQSDDFSEVLRQAETGDADAEYALGVRFKTGDGGTQNNLKAVEWFSKAAAQGQTMAQFELGTMYDQGLGIPENNRLAVQFYKQQQRRIWLKLNTAS